MTRQCAWCGLNMGLIDGTAGEDITHGICTPCFRDCLEELGGAGSGKVPVAEFPVMNRDHPCGPQAVMPDQAWGRQLLVLLAFLAACFATAALGAALTAVSVNNWYQALQKPAWTPPDGIFGPVWTVLFCLMALAGWYYWRRVGWSAGQTGLRFFALQLGLNAAWSGLFFALRSPGLAFVDIILLWLAIVATLWAFGRASAVAAGLLIPYLVWVSYATALNGAIWRMNL